MRAARASVFGVIALFGTFMLVVAAPPESAARAVAVWPNTGVLGVIPDLDASHGDVVAELLAARSYWRAAADAGDPHAQHNLAVALGSGPPPLRKETEAALWYRRAAEQGFIPAQINLGRQYWLGIGVRRDLDAAADWWRSAALQGSDAAMRNLVLLRTGQWNPPLAQINQTSGPAAWAPPRWLLP